MSSSSPSSSASLLERALSHLDASGLRREALALALLLLLLLRWLVGLGAYSGAGTPPLFGDYEAQRHWMELTLQLPLSGWYFNSTANDLLYWGLDYPPLTAYVSLAFGALAERVEPAMVALETSRGYESATSKVFMRTTVLLCDIAVFLPALFYVARVLYTRQQWTQRIAMPLVVLVQPAFLLIDHGHFQYNTVTLGLTALAVALIVRDHEFLGSVAFCLALNFKQMALYYAPAVGVFLFARCVYRPKSLLHLLKLGVAVVGTFALLWLPFCLRPFEGETCVTSVLQVLHRIFPFARGLFEDKVANFWCVLDLVYKIKRHVTPTQQMRLCTLATLLGFLPSTVDLLRRQPTRLRFLLALANSSLSFFLFSFQVHEKTILIPLLPLSLLFAYNSLLAGWFSFIATFSMFFLLKKDELMLQYAVLQALLLSVGVLPFLANKSYLHVAGVAAPPGYRADGSPHVLFRACVLLSLTGTVVAHLTQVLITPPTRYPHIHDYVFAAYSCGHFLLALGYCTYWQWTAGGASGDAVGDSSPTKAKTE
ncbi:hypothetical protein PybrP1_012682 [[Pythium] brassicae (nom. inval.)]|nr:hypothetical protein PybrP1_012682 [[Pythium] brassicae (nom. inval.)]